MAIADILVIQHRLDQEGISLDMPLETILRHLSYTTIIAMKNGIASDYLQELVKRMQEEIFRRLKLVQNRFQNFDLEVSREALLNGGLDLSTILLLDDDAFEELGQKLTSSPCR